MENDHMKSCSVCGCTNDESSQYCGNCGAVLSNLNQMQPEQPLPEKPAEVFPNVIDSLEKKPSSVSMGAFVGLIFLFLLPVVGVIAAIICAFFVKKNEIIRNFARASLIVMGVTFLLQIVADIVIIYYISQIINQIVETVRNQFYNIESFVYTIENLLGTLNTITDQFGIFNTITEQFGIPLG